MIHGMLDILEMLKRTLFLVGKLLISSMHSLGLNLPPPTAWWVFFLTIHCSLRVFLYIH